MKKPAHLEKELFESLPRNILINEFAEYNINDNILHLHIPKCAGIWIKSIIYDCNGMYHKFNFGHSIAPAIKGILEENNYNWDDFHKFTVVRDPWAKLWSAYKYTKWGSGSKHYVEKLQFDNNQIYYPQKLETELTVEKADELVLSGFENNNQIGDTFKEYVTNLYKVYKTKDSFLNKQFVPYYDTELQELLNNLPNNPYILPQWLYLYDVDGETPLYDKVFNLNQLSELFDWATSINNDRGIKIRALYNQKVNVSSNKIHHYNVYDDEMINQVGEMYKKDIDLFNFVY
tara:strand:- start:492 stop:1358 length:867 start_codon:yes stop_codon:yes gene_type:complete